MTGSDDRAADTASIGLLLETAQAQQEVIAAETARLQEHTRGLDQVVRIEIRRTLVEELAALDGTVQATLLRLRALERATWLRGSALGLALTVLSGLTGFASIEWYLPRPDDIQRLRLQRQELEARIAVLEEAGARVMLRRCGLEHRWCVRVDRRTPAYGPEADYMLVQAE